MRPALIYHWWNDRKLNVWEDWQNPVLVSIASFRAFDPETPIYVLDVSDVERNWMDYPHKLNFKHIRSTSRIPLLKTHQIFGQSYKICSRQFDIEWLAGRIPEDVIVSVESDLFWQGGLELPEDVDRFHFNFYNSGFYFYNKNADLTKQFLAVWKHHILLGMCNTKIRDEIMAKYDWPHFQDEACLVYIVKTFGGMAGPIDDRHNVLFNPFKSYEDEYKNALTLHFIQAMHPKNRGLLPVMVKEFYEIIRQVLSPEQLYDIYGPEYEKIAGSFCADEIRYENLGLIKKGKDYLLDNVTKLMG
jgi:hypothetical protein